MFFEVRVFDDKGDLKKVIKPKRLSKKFWKSKDGALPDFHDNELPNEEWDSGKVTSKAGVYSESLYE